MSLGGTIPSKTLREAVLQLTGFRERTLYGRDYRKDTSVQDLSFRVQAIVSREMEVIRAQLKRNGISVFEGQGQFAHAHTVEVTGAEERFALRGEHILIACGTRPARSPDIPFDGKRILDTDQILTLGAIPREMIVVGAGVIGLEFCSFFAALGAKVTLIDQRTAILDFADREILEALTYHLRRLGTTFRLGEKGTSLGTDHLEASRIFQGTFPLRTTYPLQNPRR